MEPNRSSTAPKIRTVHGPLRGPGSPPVPARRTAPGTAAAAEPLSALIAAALQTAAPAAVAAVPGNGSAASVAQPADGFRAATRAAGAQVSGMPAASRPSAGQPEAAVALEQLETWLSGLSQSAGAVSPETGALIGALQGAIAQGRALGLASETDAGSLFTLLGQREQIEQALHSLLASLPQQPAESTEAKPALGPQARVRGDLEALLALMQARPGQGPLGYAPRAGLGGASALSTPAFGRPQAAPTLDSVAIAYGGPVPAPAAGGAAPQRPGSAPAPAAAGGEFMQEAAELGRSPALPGAAARAAGGEQLSPARTTEVTESIEKANGQQAAQMAKDPNVLAKASPKDKAKLFDKLQNNTFGGIHGEQQGRLALDILKSCKTKEEYDQVVQKLGGPQRVQQYIHDPKIKQEIGALESRWNKSQDAAAERAVSLLERASSPEEAQRIANELGGSQLKHGIRDKKLLERLEAVSKRFQLPALGYGMAPEAVAKMREELDKAVKDPEKALKLVENKDMMRVASPEMKARLVQSLSGHNERHKVAAYKVLSSCTNKAEFDRVLDLAGGKATLERMAPSKEMPPFSTLTENGRKLNELMGAWGRTDAATRPEIAKKFEGLMTDPAKRAQYGAVRQPSAGEVAGVGGQFAVPAGADSDPALGKAGEMMQAAKQSIQKNTFDIGFEPQAQTELILEQRRREVDGKPPLDWTKLTAEAEKITSDPELEKKARERYNIDRVVDRLGPNDPVPKDVKEGYITAKMQELAKQNGLSEQTMKSLVTQRMGQVYSEGASHMQAPIGALKQQLGEVEKRHGKDSAEARKLRENIEKIEKATGPYLKHVGEVGQIYTNMFPVPKDDIEIFGEVFGKVFQLVADLAAAIVSCIPGVGQIIGGVYAGVRAVISLAQGDPLGALTSVLGAIPGVGQAVGGAVGTALQVGGRLAQAAVGVGKGIADGDPLAVIGGLAAGAGGIGNLGGVVGQVASGVSQSLKVAQGVTGVGIGIANGDVGMVLGSLSGVAGSAAGTVTTVGGAIGGSTAQTAVQVAQGLRVAQSAVGVTAGIATGDASAALGAVSGLAGGIGSMAGPNTPFGQVMSYAARGAQLGAAISSGDPAQIGSAATSLAGPLMREPALQGVFRDRTVRDVVSTAVQAVPAIGALASGDVSGALGALSDGLGRVPGSPEVRQALGFVGDGLRLADGLRTGDFSRAMNGLASGAQRIASGPEAGQLGQAIGQMTNVVAAVATGDPGVVGQALSGAGGNQGFLAAFGGGALSQALGNVAQVAGDVLRSPEMGRAMELTEAGTRFVSGLASGDFGRALDGVASVAPALGGQVAAVREVLGPLQPMVGSMVRGDFGRALGALRANEATAAQAEQLASLETLGDLASGRALEAVRRHRDGLQSLERVRERLRQVRELEQHTQSLAEAARNDVEALGARLLTGHPRLAAGL
jgi:hypothetical protein